MGVEIMTKPFNSSHEKKLKELDQRKRSFNGLTAKEWASLSKNVWDDVSSTRAKKHIEQAEYVHKEPCNLKS